MKVPAKVQKALRTWRDNRDLVVELIAEQGTGALNDDERDGLLSAANDLAILVDRWLPAPSTTGGGDHG